jgi:hypothetical protein
MASTGNVGSIDVQGAYEQSFGVLKAGTRYYDPSNRLDLRAEGGSLQNAYQAGLKAMNVSGMAAGTADKAIIPIYLDPQIIDTSRKFTPAVEIIPRVSNMGVTAEWTTLSKGAAFTAVEDAALADGEATKYEVYKSDGTTKLWTGTVGTSNADLVINGRSLNDTLSRLEERLNILNVNEAPNVLGLVTGDNLLINPSFENLYTVNKSGEWNGYDDGTILQGWVREAGNFDQIDNYTLPSAPNAAPTHGNYFLDLEGSNSNQLAISQTVSGGLDRLSAEEDPCVRFDQTNKLWIYLHGRRKIDSHKWVSGLNCSSRQLNSNQVHGIPTDKPSVKKS